MILIQFSQVSHIKPKKHLQHSDADVVFCTVMEHKTFCPYENFDCTHHGHTTCNLHFFSECTARCCAAEQTKQVIRVISPDDYDNAVRLDPSACPHVMTGDYRCGRQLIADATIDAHIQLAGMPASVHGRMELDALAGFVESAIAALDSGMSLRQQGPRPGVPVH